MKGPATVPADKDAGIVSGLFGGIRNEGVGIMLFWGMLGKTGRVHY